MTTLQQLNRALSTYDKYLELLRNYDNPSNAHSRNIIKTQIENLRISSSQMQRFKERDQVRQRLMNTSNTARHHLRRSHVNEIYQIYRFRPIAPVSPLTFIDSAEFQTLSQNITLLLRSSLLTRIYINLTVSIGAEIRVIRLYDTPLLLQNVNSIPNENNLRHLIREHIENNYEEVDLQEVNIKIIRVNPEGTSYASVDRDMRNKKSTICPNNEDDNCFFYACVMALHYTEFKKDYGRVSKYKDFFPKYDRSMLPEKGVCFTKHRKEIEEFEVKNDIKIIIWNSNGKFDIIRNSVNPSQTAREVHLTFIVNQDLTKAHYCVVKDYRAFNSKATKCEQRKDFCYVCTKHFTRGTQSIAAFNEKVEAHRKICKASAEGQFSTEITFPTQQKSRLNGSRLLGKAEPVPFVIYGDTESMIMHDSEDKHIWYSFSLKLVCRDPKYTSDTIFYAGPDVADKFYETLETFHKTASYVVNNIVPIIKSTIPSECSEKCYYCNKTFEKTETPVADHDHITGNFRGWAHKGCNVLVRLYKPRTIGPVPEDVPQICTKCKLPCTEARHSGKMKNCPFKEYKHEHCLNDADKKSIAGWYDKFKIPIIMHNSMGYDSHHITRNFNSDKHLKSLHNPVFSGICKNKEEMISFEIGPFKFMDSFKFLTSSLEKLVEKTGNLKYTEEYCKSAGLPFDHMRGKLIYPYTFAKTLADYDTEEFPKIEDFFNDLSKEACKPDEYEKAKRFYEKYCKTFADFTKIYQISDTLLLADVFEEFRQKSFNMYGLDPLNDITLPGYSWNCFLYQLYRENPEFSIDLITNKEMNDMFSIRGGISMITKKYAKANNKYLNDYDPTKPSSYIIYVDANSLYPTQMRKHLPSGNFRWTHTTWTTQDIMALDHTSSTGYRFRVDIHFPESIHENLKCFPPLVYNREIATDELSYEQTIQLNGREHIPTRKLVGDFYDKIEYDIDYRLLQFILKLGGVIKKIHAVLSFDQSQYMKSYIQKNIDLRKTQTGIGRETPKLQMNALYGKTCQNPNNISDSAVTNDLGYIRKSILKPNFKDVIHISNQNFILSMAHMKLEQNKPRFIGCTILDLAKLDMLEIFYDTFKTRYGSKCELLATDTDSLMMEIETDDILEDFKTIPIMDFSNYDESHEMYCNENNAKAGYIKDEFQGSICSEFVGLRPKVYSFVVSGKQKNTAKGVPKSVVKRELNHEVYKSALFDNVKTTHTFKTISKSNHNLNTVEMTKAGLCSFDDKRFLLEDGISTIPFGYKK